MKKKNVLIFPAGTEIAFEIVNALKYSKFVDIYGGTSEVDHSQFIYKKLIGEFPYIDDADFLEYLNWVIKKYNIDCIYPAHDSVCMFLSENRNKIEAQVIVTDFETTSICRSKRKTYELFQNEIFIPKTYDIIDEINEYPVFVKPSVGQGSQGVRLINSKVDLERIISENEDYVVCEYLPGMEYTVDCLTDGDGKLLITKLRDRERIRAGISVRSQNVDCDSEIVNIAEKINERLHFIGAWFFQVKKNSNGKYRLMEISPRIPGTMGLSRSMGINFPMLTLFIFWGYPISVIDNGYGGIVDRAFYSAYKMDVEYQHIYVDFDDTLIINGEVNVDLIRFLYQEMNNKKKIYLLSKHKADIYVDLKKYRISELMFDEIMIIDVADEKSKYIKHKDSIFIDDSFAERKKIKDVLGIPVYDLDMIDSLIDWKI